MSQSETPKTSTPGTRPTASWKLREDSWGRPGAHPVSRLVCQRGHDRSFEVYHEGGTGVVVVLCSECYGVAVLEVRS